MRLRLSALLLLALACTAQAGSVTSNSTVNSSTSVTSNSSVSTHQSVISNSGGNVSSSTSITSSGGTGQSTSFCSTSDGFQQCEIRCERPKVARCVEGTAERPPRCTCRQPRKHKKRQR